jgi:hypothetical protein
MTDVQFWQTYFLLCGELIAPSAPAAPALSVQLAPPIEQQVSGERGGDVAAATAAAAAVDTPPAVPAPSGEEEAAADEPVALEAYLEDALRPSAGCGSDDDGGSDGDAEEGDAALEAEFAALLRSGSSGSLESVSDSGEAAT